MTITDNRITKLENATKLFEPNFSKFLQSLNTKFIEVQTKLRDANKDGTRLDYYKWLDFDYLRKINEETKKLAAKYKSANFKHALVIGMGGSGINSLVLKNALYEFIPKAKKLSSIELLIQNNLDPVSILSKLENINLKQTLFIIISKSGSTDEVTRNLSTVLDFWQTNDSSFSLENFAKQTVIITEPAHNSKTNYLHELRAEILSKTGVEIAYLENDPNIGGRFSLFSPVGMFSAELMGLSSDALINAAEKAWISLIQAKSIQESTIAQMAAFDSFLSEKGFTNRYSMVYSDSLEAVNKFRAQLKGESLNKTGISALIHVAGIGTVNHHSDLELLLKKNNGVLLEQVYFAQPAADHVNQGSLDKFQTIAKQSNYESLIKNHIKPLATYMLENSAPVIESIIPSQDEAGIGEYCMQDMLVTVVQAGLQDSLGSTEKLDLAIRQHEVERYKKSLRK